MSTSSDSNILKTDAIVLRSIEYGETSQIVTMMTRARGKQTVMAKGARRPKSRFGSTLQPMSYTQVVIYHKSSRSVQTLSESSHVALFKNLARDMEKLAIGLRIVELVSAFSEEDQPSPSLFNLTLQVLQRLDETHRHAENLLPYFELRLAGTLGFAPAIDKSAVEDLKESGGFLHLDSGHINNEYGHPRSYKAASRAALRAFAVMARADFDMVMRLRMDGELYREVTGLADEYLRYHVESFPTRGAEVLAQLTRSRGSRGPSPD